MDINGAKTIAQCACNRRLIDAIKYLRMESSMGLINAKAYLEEHRAGGEDALYNKLCEDFVQDKRDLLYRARNDRTLLDKYIQQLEAEIAQEEFARVGQT